MVTEDMIIFQEHLNIFVSFYNSFMFMFNQVTLYEQVFRPILDVFCVAV